LPNHKVSQKSKPSKLENFYKSITIAITGYIGYGNVGDEAMLDSAVHLLNQVGVDRISVFSAANSGRCT
jgi:exopolysaccharide biosynthesis predicted pyruvyltransferase EpsI